MSITNVTKRISIEMSGVTQRYKVTAKQGDRATRFVEVTLLNNSEEYTVPVGSVVRSYIKKPDGKHVYSTCTFTGAKVTVSLDSQSLAAAGTALCEIVVLSADMTQRITSVTFEIEIEPQVSNDEAIQSSNEMSALDDQLKQYQTAEQARAKAEEARKSEESKRASAESTRQQKETARQTAEGTRETQETARQTAEAARDKAEKAREAAEKQRASAETARDAAEKQRAAAETTRGKQETARQTAEAARAKAETGRVEAEKGRVAAEEVREETIAEALEKANQAVLVATQIRDSGFIEDRDDSVKYSYAIYAQNGIPHMALSQIEE